MADDNDLIRLLIGDDIDHEHGPSRTRSLIECARRVYLNELQESVGEQNILTPAFEARNVGTIVHKLTEMHHIGRDPEEAVPLRADNPDLDVLLNGPMKRGCSAWELFNKYADEFPGWFWGNLIAAEAAMDVPFQMKNGNIIKRSMRADALFEMDAQTLDRVNRRFGLSMETPGLMIWDLKTATSKDDNMVYNYEWDPQPVQYMVVAEQLGYRPQGMIIFRAIRYKTDRQERFYAVYLDREDLLSGEALHRFNLDLEESQQNEIENKPNRRHCMAYNHPCPHRVSGVCNGT